MRDLESKKPFPRFIARDESMAELCDGFQRQLGVLKGRAPLYAVAGSPGAGKTRFLLQLQNKDELYINAQRFMTNDEDSALFHPDNVLVINITFNSFMPIQNCEESSDIERLIATRLLYQYVVAFNSFWHFWNIDFFTSFVFVYVDF
jgi:hypothetical protein